MVHTSVTDAWSLQSTVISSSSGTSSSTRNSMSPTQISPKHSCHFRSCSVDFRRGTRTGTGTTGTGETSSSSLVGLFGTKRPSVSSSSSWDENVIGINSSLDAECRDDSNDKDEECNVKQVTNVDDDDDDVIAVDAAEQQEEGTEQQILSSQETTRSGNNSLQQTIRGGPSMIFAMARRMLVWDDEDYQAGRVLNDASNKPRTKVKVLPRWHPHDGIADANPYFRTQSPVMNNKGYAVTIQRNSRKKNKPGLWRHAYRTYVKVRDMELLQQQQQQQRGEEKDDVEGEGLLVEKKSSTTSLMVESCNVTAKNSNNNLTMTVGSQTMDVVRPRYRYPYLPSKVKIRRENRHFQGALVACAKLGLWREAMFILNEMEGMQGKDVSTIPNKKKSITINEYVILLVIKACIRGMKHQLNNKDRDAKQKAEEGCRESLDSARDILFSIKKKYSISPSPMIVNPLSSAYQYIGLYSDAEKVLDLLPVPTMNQKEQHQQQQERKLQVNTAATFLMKGIKKDMTETRSTQNDDNAAATSKPTSLLAISSHCKDDASYNILIKNSVLQGNWASAIHSLREMTNAGYYPKSKSLNSWSEAAMKRERRPKKPRWIKQRERILMRNTLSD